MFKYLNFIYKKDDWIEKQVVISSLNYTKTITETTWSSARHCVCNASRPQVQAEYPRGNGQLLTDAGSVTHLQLISSALFDFALSVWSVK